MNELWRQYPWPWILVPITIQTVIGQTDYTLASNVGAVVVLTVGNGGTLKVLSLKRYYDWFLNNQIDPSTGLATVPANGNVTHYVHIGRDGNNNIQIRLWKPPSVAVTVTGFGKQRIVKPVIGDIAAGNSIQYFPDEVCDVLQEGVLSDVYEEAGQKQLSASTEQHYYNMIGELKGDQMSDQDLTPQTPPPDQWLSKHRRRSKSSTGVF